MFQFTLNVNGLNNKKKLLGTGGIFLGELLTLLLENLYNGKKWEQAGLLQAFLIFLTEIQCTWTLCVGK